MAHREHSHTRHALKHMRGFVTWLLRAAVEIQATACMGDGSFIEDSMIVTDAATAIAQAFTEVFATCEAEGAEGTNGCSATSGQVDAVAEATVSLPATLCRYKNVGW